MERGGNDGEVACCVSPSASSSSSRVFRLLAGELGGGSAAMAFEKWVALVRKRSGTFRSSGFPHRHSRLDPQISFDILRFAANSFSVSSSRSFGLDHAADLPRNDQTAVFFGEGESQTSSSEQAPETSLWERLGNAAAMDIESGNFPWSTLSSLHHTEHACNSEQTEDDMNRALEVTVNSGGVVFFALFGSPSRESAAVMKIASSRMATQSERLGYELAKLLGVCTPQARIIHSSSPEWQEIKTAAEKARRLASDDAGEITCSELLEALELSRCLLLMNYVHGSSLLESTSGFCSLEAAEQTAAALGRVLLLDLVIRNEDRLPCRHLGWRGNPSNLLHAHMELSLVDRNGELEGEKSSMDIKVMAIDSSVPRRPPAGKRLKDQADYPKLVELLLNSAEFSSNLLHEISRGRLGLPSSEEAASSGDSSLSSSTWSVTDAAAIVNGFRGGFRAALRDLQGFHLFLLTLNQKLDSQLRSFLNLICRSSGEAEKEEVGALDSHIHGDTIGKISELCMQRATPRLSSPGGRAGFESPSPLSRCFRDNGENRSLRLTMKLRDFSKLSKSDGELNIEMEQWNENFRNEVLRLCQDNHFNSGFFDGGDSSFAIDAYELKVRLEHILERIALITDAANTEKPSWVTAGMFIGGALAARSTNTLHYLGISHILCLCANEIGQSDSQFPDQFQYKNFSISDDDDEDISGLFEEAFEFIDAVERWGGKVLVHCFEGRSRSATVVLAYLMQRKKLKLVEAWNLLKKAHSRAQPNDGFARVLVDMEKKLHGAVSMQWQHRRPTIKVCPICGKNAGLSSSSLKLHLQKSHKNISSGSVDSAMAIEIQRILDSLKISRGGSVSPTVSRSTSQTTPEYMVQFRAWFI
ncbi:dual specificity protein phosphatase family protein isoform X2 [Wolffia australiana]